MFTLFLPLTSHLISYRFLPPMSKILKIFFLIFFIFLYKAYAQNLEIGLGAGGTNTRSDVSNFNILNTRYAFNGFVRWNFTYAWVARLDYKYLLIAGLDKNNSSPIATARNYNEFHPTVHQISINAEYNFLDFRSAFKKVKLCPYITAGVGLFKLSQYEDQYGSTQGNFNFCIPFGLGLKYALTKNFNLGDRKSVV